ncbi:acyl-CoA thioesterase [Brevibacillus sp. H7]|uniref:acyl-CoA thioesterase n=1 Tax=Brevibacillus sp. H7 TaxID=3349138 RepID=UPI003808770B
MSTPTIYSTQIRVRYSETDQMGVVYHANYLNWFEVGRTEFFRQAGFRYRDLEKKGILLPVAEANVSFKQPALYDDLVDIRTWIADITPVRLTYAYEVYRVADEQLLVFGRTMHVFTNAALKPIRLSRLEPEIYAWLEAQSSTQNRHDEGSE